MWGGGKDNKINLGEIKGIKYKKGREINLSLLFAVMERLCALVDGHIHFAAQDLAKGVLRELLFTDSEQADLLIGDGGLVVVVNIGLEVRVHIGDAVLGEEVLVGIDLGNDGVV